MNVTLSFSNLSLSFLLQLIDYFVTAMYVCKSAPHGLIIFKLHQGLMILKYNKPFLFVRYCLCVSRDAIAVHILK